MTSSMLALLLTISAVVGSARPSRSQAVHVLSPSAQPLAQTRLPGFVEMYVVVYRSRGLHLGLERRSTVAQPLLWSRRLPGALVQLATPGPAGLFVVLTRTVHKARRLFGYRWNGQAVTSVIAGHDSGEIFADEGIWLTSVGFSTHTRDWHHVGSVHYRLVTHYGWEGGLYRPIRTVEVPDYPRNAYPTPCAVMRTNQGNTSLLRLEIADTEQARETGLMYRHYLDPDTGMIFVWPQQIRDSFWMENTYIPLSVAFLGADGRIQEIQDMAPLTTDLHTPDAPYWYAIEVNQGFFARKGVGVGDRLELHLAPLSLSG